MERWGVANNPLVKVAGLSVLLFSTLNGPSAFVIILVGILLYAIASLGIVDAHRRRHRIVGRPELALQLAARILSNLREDCSRTVALGWVKHQSRRRIQGERKAELRRYKRERNRTKREQARGMLVPTRRTNRWVRSR
jgi:hypothetical protein